MPELVVDDTPILGDQGDIFEIDEDFDPPAGSSTRYVSDIHNPKGKPQRRAPQAQRSAMPKAQIASGRQSPPSGDYADFGPRLLTDSPVRGPGYGYQGPRVAGYRPVTMHQAPYWPQQAQQGPMTGSLGHMPHPHQLSIQRQLGAAGYSGYGGGYAAPAPYPAPSPRHYPVPSPVYSGSVQHAMPPAPSYGGYGGYGYGAPGAVAAPGYGGGGYEGYGY